MSRQVCTTVYQFDELSEKAKEKARDWWRSGGDSSDFEYVIEDVVRMAGILGIEISTRPVKLMGGSTRQDPCVWWQVGYCQSDGAGFDGTYSYAKQAHKTIRTEAPQDADLHEMADTLYALQRKYRYQLTATIKDRDHWPQIEGLDDIDFGNSEDYKALRDVFRRFNQWIYDQLRTEDEYRSADAQVDEEIRANEYEFTEGGDRV